MINCVWGLFLIFVHRGSSAHGAAPRNLQVLHGVGDSVNYPIIYKYLKLMKNVNTEYWPSPTNVGSAASNCNVFFFQDSIQLTLILVATFVAFPMIFSLTQRYGQ